MSILPGLAARALAPNECNYDSDSDDEIVIPTRRAALLAVVAANRVAKMAAEKAAEDKAAQERVAAEAAAKTETGLMTYDQQHGAARRHSEARKVLARREEMKKRSKGFYDQMEKVRAVQQAAVTDPHANTEKLQTRLRMTRRSKELLETDAASRPASAYDGNIFTTQSQ